MTGTFEVARRRLLESSDSSVHAVVVGAGRSGMAAAALLRQRGAQVRLMDDRSDPQRDVGPIESVTDVDLVVLSPGVPRRRPELQDAIRQGTLVGEIELASWFVPVPIVGITGTNGKSTTTALVAHGLNQAGWRAFAGGNLGRPLSELVTRDEIVDVAVVELSSFQLESVESTRLRASAWLNLQPDHLDRYPSVEAYAATKRRIVEHTDELVVLNADDEACRRDAPEGARWFSRGGAQAAVRQGTVIEPEGHAVRRDGDRLEGFALAQPGLRGRHNHANAAAAVEILRGLGVGAEDVQRGLVSFGGLAHRLEPIPTSDGRSWYNDSKATNVASALVALEAVPGTKTLILGGRAKAESPAPLVEAARDHGVRLVVAFGESADHFRQAFEGSLSVLAVATLEEAVDRAAGSDSEAVLLSPASASLDQFRSFEERGDRFRELVREVVG